MSKRRLSDQIHHVKDESASTFKWQISDGHNLPTLFGSVHFTACVCGKIPRRSVASSRSTTHLPTVVGCTVIGGLSSDEYSAMSIVARHGKSGLNVTQFLLTAFDLLILVSATHEHSK